MAEALKIKINSDSSELRSDIDKNIKKMMELSNKYKEVNDKLDQRGPEDFAKSLSSALEEVNGKLDKANQKLKDTEEEYNKAAQKAHELSGGKDQDAYDKALASQQKAEEKMNSAKSDVESLDAQKAEIVRQTTNEYNVQTDALQLQAQELQSQFGVLSAINDVDMSDLGTTELLEKVNKIGTAASSMWSNFKSGASNVFGKIKSFASSCAEKVKGIFNKKTFDGANSGLKSLVGTAGQFTMALLGARGAFTLIRKAVSQILEDNQTLANTVNTIWNSVVSLIAPAVNAIVSVFATILNYVVAIISYISSLDVLGLMKKAQKKATSSTGSSGSSSSKKKQQQQYSFDTAETIQKQDDSSSGGASGAVDQVNDSYLKGIELSDTLLRWAEKLKAIWQDIQQIGANLWEGIKEGLEYMNSGQRILNTCVKLVDAILDDIKECTAATVEWSANLNFGPFFDALATMLESLEPILENIGDLFVFLYTNALLPIAKWVLECGLPEFLQTIASWLDVINQFIELAKPTLQWIWDNFLEPLAGSVGDTIISIFEQLQEYAEYAGNWLTDHPEFVEFCTLAAGLIATFTAIYAAVQLVIGILGTFASFIATPIGMIAALIIAGGLLIANFGDIDAAIGAMQQMFQGLLDFITGVFSGDWNKAWTGCLEIFQGFSNLMNTLVDAIVVMFQNMGIDISGVVDGLKEICNGLVEFITGVFSGDWSKAWEGIKDIFKGVWNAIVSLLESAANFIVDGLNKLSFDVPSWVPAIGGSHFGLNISHVSLPRLAKGAVIPPNQEFLAVLGDQTRGKNIETPESLLREIVQEESGTQEINIVAQGEMSQLIKLLKLKLQEEDKRVGSSLIVGG